MTSIEQIERHCRAQAYLSRKRHERRQIVTIVWYWAVLVLIASAPAAWATLRWV